MAKLLFEAENTSELYDMIGAFYLGTPPGQRLLAQLQQAQHDIDSVENAPAPKTKTKTTRKKSVKTAKAKELEEKAPEPKPEPETVENEGADDDDDLLNKLTAGDDDFPTLDETRAVLEKLVEAKGTKVAVDLAMKYTNGKPKISEVPEDKRADFIKAAQEAMA